MQINERATNENEKEASLLISLYSPVMNRTHEKLNFLQGIWMTSKRWLPLTLVVLTEQLVTHAFFFSHADFVFPSIYAK